VENVYKQAVEPPTTLTAFFHLHERDNFAKTLLYNEIPKSYTWNSQQKK